MGERVRQPRVSDGGGQVGLPVVGSRQMLAHDRLCAFAAGLEALVAARAATEFESAWERRSLTRLGWDALALARRTESVALGPVLGQVDRLLLAVLDRSRALRDPHVTTFRVPELERWQHASAATLVGARWGGAGLKTVVADTSAPTARRYFALLALAARHPPGAWPVFARYLAAPTAHHAFLAAAVEAARYYPGHAADLIRLFDRIRGDLLLRRFLGPKILESLYALDDPAAIPLFEELAVTGHTDPDPERCEVTRALVAIRRRTGRLAPNSKFRDGARPEVRRALDAAQRCFDAERDVLRSVRVI